MKFYAVKKGYSAGVYTDWNTCKKQVHGYSGAIYKSFATEKEAKAFIKGNTVSKTNAKKYTEEECAYYEEMLKNHLKYIKHSRTSTFNEFLPVDYQEHDMIAYVDGSFGMAPNCYSSGIVILESTTNDVKLFKGLVTNPHYSSARNVSGEILASIYVLKYAYDKGYKKIKIYHDYEGIAKWYNGYWKSNSDNISGLYQYFKDKYCKKIKVDFEWVHGHTGDYYNEVADKLAKLEII